MESGSEATLQSLEPARGYWVLMLWSAVVTAAYVGVFLAVFGAEIGGGVSAEPQNAATGLVLLVPILIFSSLISGTRERFDVRRKPSAGYWVIFGLVLAGFLALGALTVIQVSYPWWLNIAVPVALFGALAVSPIRGIVRTPRSAPARWSTEPLSPPVRWMTVFIGVAMGLLLAASAFELVAAISSIIVMLTLVFVLASWRASFGLPQVGYAWGVIHWVAFGLSATVVFVSVSLMNFTEWFSTAHLVSAGLLVAMVMTAAVMLPPSPEEQVSP